jgi:hypothetical protein
MMVDPFHADRFADMWDDWSDANYALVLDATSFLEAVEDLCLAECVPVDEAALDDAFSYERGIEPGGMMWRLTAAGQSRYKACRTSEGDA